LGQNCVTWHVVCTTLLPWGGKKGIEPYKTWELGSLPARKFFPSCCISTYLTSSSRGEKQGPPQPPALFGQHPSEVPARSRRNKYK
jgi:hypothetical protein